MGLKKLFWETCSCEPLLSFIWQSSNLLTIQIFWQSKFFLPEIRFFFLSFLSKPGKFLKADSKAKTSSIHPTSHCGGARNKSFEKFWEKNLKLENLYCCRSSPAGPCLPLFQSDIKREKENLPHWHCETSPVPMTLSHNISWLANVTAGGALPTIAAGNLNIFEMGWKK